MNDEEIKKLMERLDQVEKQQKEKDEKIATLEKTNTELASKIADLKINGLVKQVEPVKEEQPQEDITFDFDI